MNMNSNYYICQTLKSCKKFVIYLIFFLSFLCNFSCNEQTDKKIGQSYIDQSSSRKSEQNNSLVRAKFSEKDLVFNGHSVRITKHAKCRMGCRNMDAYEIQDLLDKGTVNFKKSNRSARPCPTIAIEGNSIDGQKSRLIIGTCDSDYLLVTVIDLKNEWKCECR